MIIFAALENEKVTSMEHKHILCRIAVWAVLLIAAFLPARAATINGILVDAADTTELIEATVRLLHARPDSALVRGTTTNIRNCRFVLSFVQYYITSSSRIATPISRMKSLDTKPCDHPSISKAQKPLPLPKEDEVAFPGTSDPRQRQARKAT